VWGGVGGGVVRWGWGWGGGWGVGDWPVPGQFLCNLRWIHGDGAPLSIKRYSVFKTERARKRDKKKLDFSKGKPVRGTAMGLGQRKERNGGLL